MRSLQIAAGGPLSLSYRRAAVYARAERAEGTVAVYGKAWAAWLAWCHGMQTKPLPARPEAVAAWLADLAHDGKSVSTINVALSAVLFVHRAAGHDLSRRQRAINAVMAGIVRTRTRPIKRAAPLEIADLRRLIKTIDGAGLRDLRDRALILVGFWGALRRSEITALDVAGRSLLEITKQGVRLHLTATKGCAATQTVAVPRRKDDLCPAAALRRYLAAARLSDGPLFRPISKAGRLIERRLNPASVRHIFVERLKESFGKLRARTLARRLQGLSPHSLRAGFITSAAKARAPEHLIQRTTRHRSVDVLRSYIRGADPFADNAARYLR